MRQQHLAELAAEGMIRGEVLQPGDDDYDDARSVWNAMVDKRPRSIVRCRGTADVIRAVNHARENELLLSIRCGGHSFAGKSVCDGGVAIDLSPMSGVRVDPAERTARVQGGATWADVDHETQAFGLATTGGLISHTGVGGLTLGGGIGWLARKHGLSVDNLISADVVTAEGELVHASETENPDLFWGLRGGGGNFGVVTSFEFRLHPVGPEVMGGFVIYPHGDAADGLRFYREFMEDAPDEVMCYPLLGNVPPEPPFPEEHQGRTALYLAACYVGPVDAGEAALRPLREIADPILDAIQPMPYTALQKSFDAVQAPGNRWYGKSSFWGGLPDGAIDALVDGTKTLAGPLTSVFLEPMGGAVNRVQVDATAFPHRDVPYNFGITAGWIDPAEDDENVAWSKELFKTMAPYRSGVYVNYLGGDEEDRTGEAYGPNHDRLVEVKREWDPENLFRMNQNIVPTG